MGERKRIGQGHIKALRPGQVVWDSAVIGFGARRQRSEAVSYFVFYRTTEGRQRWQTIGRHGAPWVPDTARDEARRLLGDVARGEDPASVKQAIRKAITVAELCDRYMVDAKAGLVLIRFGSGKKASTLAIDEGRIARHIKPVLGSLAVTAITAADIRNLRDAVAAGKTACYVKTGAVERAQQRARCGFLEAFSHTPSHTECAATTRCAAFRNSGTASESGVCLSPSTGHSARRYAKWIRAYGRQPSRPRDSWRSADGEAARH